MPITAKDLVAAALSRMSVQGGVAGSVGRIGLTGMLATGALPGNTGVSGRIGNILSNVSSSGPIAVEVTNWPLTFGTSSQAQEVTKVQSGDADETGQTQKPPEESETRRLTGKLLNAQLSQPASKGYGNVREWYSGGAAVEGGEAAEAGGMAAAGVVAGMALVALEAAKLPGELQDWGASLIESQRTLAQYSGQTASAFALLDIGRLQRDIRTAQDTSGTASELAKSQNRLEEATQPWKEAAANIENSIASTIVNAFAAGLESLNKELGTKFGFDPNTGPKFDESAAGILAERTFGHVIQRWNPPIAKKDEPALIDAGDIGAMAFGLGGFILKRLSGF